MNTLDFIILLILAYFIISGYFKGLINSLLEIAGFLISILIFRFLYPIISSIILKTIFFEKFKIFVGGRIQEYGVSKTSNILIDLGIPEFLREKFTEIMGTGSILNYAFDNAIEYIATIIFNLIIAIITFILVLILVIILMVFITRSLKIISKFPIIRQANKIGGVFIGGFMGILFIWFIGIFILILILFPKYEDLNNLIEASKIAKPILKNNYLLDFLLNLLKDIILK